MAVPAQNEFFMDPSRCIGCQACVQACGECDTHKGTPLIQLDYIQRDRSTQTVPVVCLHCDAPTCAEVCPADAIKRTADGVVQSARKPRCIACNNCVLACPFGVPKMQVEQELMMKCDLCYDRTSEGKKPMCATVCPSQALFFGTREEIASLRPRSRPVNSFRFGEQIITTKVHMMTPALGRDGRPRRHEILDVTEAMHDTTSARSVPLDILSNAFDEIPVPATEGSTS
jgi:Fe-S-cluster-containing dehydrogenase component